MKRKLLYLVSLIFGIFLFSAFLNTNNLVYSCWNDGDCNSCGGCAANCTGANFPTKQGTCACCKNCQAGNTSSSCGGCSVSCGGGTRDCEETDNTTGQTCATWTQNCNMQSCCTPTSPAAPGLVSPANGTQLRKGNAVTLQWSDVTAWGTGCPSNSNSYQVCISSNQAGCDIANWVNTGGTSQYAWTPATGDNFVTWQARSNNGSNTAASALGSVCVEGFSASNPAYLSAWSSCNANHVRTRTCTENCGTDDCAPFILSENCTGRVSGTIFDASEYAACPAYDPVTGYSIGIPVEEIAQNHTLTFADQSVAAPHPWAPITTPLKTDNNGNYSFMVYAPATYTYDFDNFEDIYITSGGPKLTCTAPTAVVAGSPIACMTQPCTVLPNMSFGFWKKYGGWWQVTGGSVYAGTGIKSGIPRSLPAAQQNLILPDIANGNRLGFLSYGVPRPIDIFGINYNAKASASQWEKESKYTGPVYDWDFYNKRFNLYTVTDWDGAPPTYDDGGRGYQILRHAGSVDSFSYTAAVGEKIIFEVDGNVTVTGDIIVPNGSFLAIIANGAITFTAPVARADGWFVSDTISIPCLDVDGNGCDRTDNQFRGSGSFVAWLGMNMTRDRDVTNNTEPSETFSYREDLYNNAPEPMRIYTKKFKPFIP